MVDEEHQESEQETEETWDKWGQVPNKDEAGDWDTGPSLSYLKGIKRGFYPLYRWYQVQGNFYVPGMKLQAVSREPTTNMDLTRLVKSVPKPINVNIDLMHKLLDKQSLYHRDWAMVSYIEGVMIHCGLPVVGTLASMYPRRLEFMLEFVEHAKPADYNILPDIPIPVLRVYTSEGAPDRNITCLNAYDASLIAQIANGLGWERGHSAVRRYCLIAAFALGEGLIPEPLVEPSKEEIDYLRRALSGEERREVTERLQGASRKRIENPDAPDWIGQE